MKKVNFNSLQNIHTPEAWLEKAAAIPAGSQKKRAFPLRYRFVAAASLVLISVIGLLLFPLFGNHGSSPVVIGNSNIAASESQTDETSFTGQNDTTEGTAADSSTDAAGNPASNATAQPAPTVNGSQPTSGRITPTSSSAPATEHTPAATEAPAPTETPEPAEAAETEVSYPTDAYASVESNISFFATFDASLLSEGEAVYCVYSPADYATGSYASAVRQQADYYITQNGMVCANCEVMIEDDPEVSATYRYAFITESGRVLASGTQAV